MKSEIPKDELGRPTRFRSPSGREINYDTNSPDDKGWVECCDGFDLDEIVSREEVLQRLHSMVHGDGQYAAEDKISEYDWVQLCIIAYSKFKDY